MSAEVKRDMRQMGWVLTVPELDFFTRLSRSLFHLALSPRGLTPMVDNAWALATDRRDLLLRDCRVRDEV